MTIYKTQNGEKKTDKDPEVLTEPLVSHFNVVVLVDRKKTVDNKMAATSGPSSKTNV